MKKAFLFIICAIVVSIVQGQNTSKNGVDFNLQLNTITTAVPFLMIAPDSRSGAMGDVGVAISPDANAMHWNPSKIAFAKNKMEISVGYSPWLKALVPDINLSYLAGYYKLDKNSGIGASLRYFSLGNITFTDAGGNTIGQYRPNEFASDVSYARKFGEQLSMGLSVRYIYSNLTNGVPVQGVESKAGTSVAADLSVFYTNDKILLGDKKSVLSFGADVSNIGYKMAYSSTSERDFIPINLRLGSALTIEIDEYQKFTAAIDFNKLLVPTPPKYVKDATNNPIPDGNGGYLIESGKDPNVGVAAGIFQSFTDAPGNLLYDDNNNFVGVEKGSKLKEELREINIGGGLEYWYADQFAVRAGYFYEHYTKGNRQYFTVGAGVKYSIFALDFSYLIPTQQQNPLANTLRFTLHFNFTSLKSNKDETLD